MQICLGIRESKNHTASAVSRNVNRLMTRKPCMNEGLSNPRRGVSSARAAECRCGEHQCSRNKGSPGNRRGRPSAEQCGIEGVGTMAEVWEGMLLSDSGKWML